MSGVPPQPPRREVVTGVPRAARRAPAHTPARSEITEQTTLGATYVRALMRSQLRIALVVLAVLALLGGVVPLLFALPGAAGPPAPLLWCALGFAVYPVMVVTARWYVRRAERNERDFTGLVEGRTERH
ncbi:hypothetical protein [Streptomyces sp. NPDC006879]|uniref:hypothetical protein n=1 Tax=Streptomyces sp. NPDC006879 TaxID=3364767 RepID=UPI0036AFA9D4